MTTHHAPPGIPRRLLERVLPQGPVRDGLVGDLHELYLERRARRGRLPADAWYWWEACAAALRYRLAGRSPEDGGAAGRITRSGRRLAGVWGQVRSELPLAGRRLARSPSFTAAAVLPLALGIAAITTIFSLVQGVLLAPLPYPDANRLVVVRHVLPGYDVDGRVPEVGAFLGQYLHYRERSRLLAEVGAYWTFDGPLAGEAGAEYLRLGGATAGLWRALGVRPVHGRLFRDDDRGAGGDGRLVTLLGHGFWTERYGGDPSAVGGTVTAQGWTYEVVGVLPPSLPLASSRPVMWSPISDARARDNPEWMVPALVGRLAPGATAEELERELAALSTDLVERYPEGTIRNTIERGRMTPRVTPLAEWIVGDVSRSVWLLFGSALLLLVVALANVGGLFLVRADAARRELAVRRALGSGRLGLAVRVLADSVLVVGGAALLGIVLAGVGVDVVGRAVPADIPRIEGVAVGWGEVGFALALALLGAGVLAALQLLHGRGRLAGALHQRTRGSGAGSSGLRLRHAFVSLQIALALVLLIGGGLLFRSARSLGSVDPGFPVEGLLTFRVPFPFSEIQAADAPGTTATPFYEELTRRLEALPGVVEVGWGSCVPLSDLCDSGGFAIDPLEDGAAAEDPAASAVHASPGFRSALGIPLLDGRDLGPEDHRERSNRVLVSEGLARRLWPGRSPIGRTFTPVALGQATDPAPFTVAGVVADIRFDNLRRDTGSMVYMPVQVPGGPADISMAGFVLRTSVPPLSLLDAVRGTVAELRPDIPVAFAETMEGAVARETAPMRFSSLLVMLAAGATVLLSALGVYGMIAYVVGLRRAEFGVRLALGAEGRQLTRMVLVRGLVTAAAGVGVGLVGAGAGSRLVQSLVFGVDPVDPATYALAAGALVLVTAGATWLPARRASRVEPAETLRAG